MVCLMLDACIFVGMNSCGVAVVGIEGEKVGQS